jgi:hypothetical protein
MGVRGSFPKKEGSTKQEKLETASKRSCKRVKKFMKREKGKRVICWNLNLVFVFVFGILLMPL